MSSSAHTSILSRLRHTRRVLRRTELFQGIARAANVLTVTALLLVLVEATLHLSIAARTVLVIGFGGVALFSIGFFAVFQALRFLGMGERLSEEDIARRVGEFYPELHDSLANALELKRIHEASSVVGYSKPLIEEAFSEVASKSASLKFDASVDRRPARKSLLAMVLALGGVMAFLTTVGVLREGMTRLVQFRTSFTPPPPFVFEITPGNVRRIRGDSVSITVRTVGKEPQHEITLQTKEEDQQYPRQTILRSLDGTFHVTLEAVKRETEYFAEAKGESSDKYTISVTDRPEIKSFAVRLVFPGYTHATPIDMEENSGDVMGITGTEARVTVNARGPIDGASLIFRTDSTNADSNSHGTSETVIPLRVDGTVATGSMTIRRSGTYTIHLIDGLHNENIAPIVYRVTALHDESPTIRVLQPQAVTDITETSKIGIVSRIHDDFGFSKMALHYRLTQSRWAEPWSEFKENVIPFSGDGKSDLDVPYIWDLQRFGLVPEDIMQFYVEVFDNDVVLGPKGARSELMTLRLPSLDAMLRESDKSQSDANQNMQEAERAAEELKQAMEQATRELRQQSQEKSLSWQEKKKLQDIVKKQEKLQEKISEAQQQIEEAVQKLESKNALSPETLQKYMELQKMFQELKSPELMQAMKRLQDAMEKVNPDQMRDAMKNLSANEEQFRQSIERTMEMLKRIQTEQKVDELQKRAEELSKQQQQLQDKTQNAQSKEERDRAAAQEKDFAESMKELRKEFEELKKKMDSMGKDMPKEEMKQTQDQLEQDAPEKEMQQAAQEMSSDPQSSQQHQQKAKQGMQNFQKNMAAVKKKMGENEQKMMMTEMRRSLQDLLDLAKREEEMKNQSQRSEPNSASLPDQAKKQANAQSDLGNVVNRMSKLAQKSFAVTPEMGKELGSALREMQNATGNLEQRQPQQAGQNQGNAVGNMNSAAMMMQQALEQMSQGQGQPGGSGMQSFMQQLNKMAGEQENINGQMGKVGNEGQLNMQQQAEMKRLSAEQQAVKNSLDQLREQQQELTGGKKNTLGDLSKIAEEMQEVINDMHSGKVNPETIQKQERILSRLLDAQRSQHERDFDKKREGNAGTTSPRSSPAELASKPSSKSMEELLRLQEAGYSKDYERRIRKYFESLPK